jgi:acyl CoA:acetate/3-ketoacid CoA transferase alpha subunit
MENAITSDFAYIKCYKADKDGNLVFRRTARNFNPDMAAAARVTIAEAEIVVDVGKLDPDEIHCPGIFVNRVIKGHKEHKYIEKLALVVGGILSIKEKS